MKNGDKFLVHKGGGSAYKGKAGNCTAITPASNMPKNWSKVGEESASQNKSLGSMANNGSCHLVTKNFNHATAKHNPNAKTPVISYKVVPKN